MSYMLCYKLIRTFGYVVRDCLQEATHRFFVIWRETAVPLHHHFFILAQFTYFVRSSDPSDNVENVETHGMQGFQIATIRASFVSFIATLSVPSYPAYLSHFLLFQAQSSPFLAQAFARTQFREFSL